MNILVIAAHPDDEALGCGGALYKLSKNRANKIFIGFAANGVGGRGETNTTKILKRREESQKAALLIRADIINPRKDEDYQFHDQRIDQADFNKIVGWIKGLIKQVHPEIIFVHHPRDLNRDHRILAEVLMVAARPSKFEFIKKIYAYEINMADTVTNFSPSTFENLKREDLVMKTKMFRAYQSEHKYWRTWKKDIETLAAYRGMNAGCDYAEAFELIRERRD